jgi:hypothetical protein
MYKAKLLKFGASKSLAQELGSGSTWKQKLTKSHARCTIRMLAQSSHVHWSHSPPAEKPVVSHLHLDNSPEMHFRWEKPWFWCCCYADCFNSTFHKKRPAKLGEETNVSWVPPSDCSLNLRYSKMCWLHPILLFRISQMDKG